MKIFLIRHGETDWNLAGRLQGRENIPLNDTGRQQAEGCGEALAAMSGMKWMAVYTSPLSRARETADIIAAVLGVRDVFEDADLMERDYGKASGLTEPERKNLFPDGLYEGVEDWELLRNRVYDAIKRCAKKFYPENIIVVSHGSAINSILAELSNHLIGTGKTRLKNACVSLLKYESDKMEIVFHNKTCDEI